MKSIVLQKDQVTFNLGLPLRKSFQITDEQQEMPDEFTNLQLKSGFYFWGYANTSQVDLQGDIFPIETLKALAGGLTQAPYNKIFLFHNYEDIAMGTIIATAVDEKGLLILASLNEDHSRAQEVWASINNGSLDGLSMGGSFLKVDTIEDEETGMTFNVAREALATEVSLTSIPVNSGSMLVGAFRKSREIMKAAEDDSFNKSIKIDVVDGNKTFYVNNKFMKSLPEYKKSEDTEGKESNDEENQENEEGEKYIKNKKLKKSMVDNDKKLISVSIEQTDNGFMLNSYDTNTKEVFETIDSAIESAKELLEKEYKTEGNSDLRDDVKEVGVKEMKKALKKSDLTKDQMTVFDKAVEDGKNEDEALKLASKLLDEQAISSTEEVANEMAENPMKTGAENAATKKKEMKKSVEGEDTEEPAEEAKEIGELPVDESSGDAASDDENAGEEGAESDPVELDDKDKETEDEAKETQEAVQERYEKSLKETEALKSRLDKFNKSLPAEESDDPENKPLRKSKVTKQSAEHSVDSSKSPKSKTPMVDWIRGV